MKKVPKYWWDFGRDGEIIVESDCDKFPVLGRFHYAHNAERAIEKAEEMIADTPDELRDMAVTIGVNVKWFQGRASAPHFDICRTKRALAVKAGALELTRREYVAKLRAIKATWPQDAAGLWTLPPDDLLRNA